MYVYLYIFDCDNVIEEQMFSRMSGHNLSMCKILYTDIITSVKSSSSSTDKDQWSLNAAPRARMRECIHCACAFRCIFTSMNMSSSFSTASLRVAGSIHSSSINSFLNTERMFCRSSLALSKAPSGRLFLT